MTDIPLPSTGSTNWSGWAAEQEDLSDIARVAARTDTGNVFTGTQKFTGGFGIGADSDPKQPVVISQTMNGPTVRASGSTLDKVVNQINAVVTGNFTGDTGSNPGFVWGQNLFLITGSTAGDGAGLNTITAGLVEANVSTPAGTTFPVVRGFHVQAAFFGASAGATVTQMESMRVSAPARKDGATAGTATNAYGLFIEAVDAAAVGASSALSLFVAGGVSRFGGRVDVDGQISTTGANGMELQGALGASTASMVINNVATGGGHVQIKLGATGSVFAVTSSGGANVFTMDNTGALSLTLGTTTTAPSAGGAGALPATPAGYATVTINGTARKVAYY